jgi:hypothetical protein
MTMKTAWRARARLTVVLVIALGGRLAEAAVCAGGTTTCGPATNVTYNGTSLIFYGSSTNGTVRSEIWYLTAPAAGTHNVVVTAAGATDVTATSMSFTGVDQATPLGTLVSAIGTDTAPTVTATTVIGEPVFDVVGAVGTTTPTAGAAQTVRQTNNTSTGLNRVVVASSTAAGQPGPVTMSWTIPSADWALTAVPIQASTALTGLGVSSFTAVWDGSNVRLAWHAGYEPDSIGFFVFRSDGGDGWVQLNADLIPGGALRGTDPSFSWTDAAPDPKGRVTYWLKDVRTDGSFSWSGPAVPRAPGAPALSYAFSQPDGAAPGPSAAESTSVGAGGCALVDRSPRGGALQVILVLGLVASIRRRKHRLALSVLFLAALLSTQLWSARPATAAGGVSVDATATGTGAIDLTFAHTMGVGANGLLVVGVVVPISCPATDTDASNCGGCGLTCALSVAPSLNSGLLGLWHFSEGTGATSVDSSGTGNTAVLTNGPKWTAGYTGDGLQFNGTSSYVEAPLGTWFGANNPLSAAAWVYATSGTNGPVFGVTSAKPPGGWNMPFLSILGSTVYGWIWNVGAGNTPISATVSLNAWHYLAITYTPGTGEIFYVDGASVGSKAGTYSSSGSLDYWSSDAPASRIAGMNSYLVGRIDEVRAYNRVLSAAEISALATARLSCSGGTCAACPTGQTSCSGSCVTTTGTDVFNCGGCGIACNTAAGETCVSGACTCTSGTDCSSVCVDVTSDPNNCAGCALSCGAPTPPAIDSGLNSSWHLDEGSGTTSADASGSGHTATLTNSPVWTTSGYVGNALTFNGTTSYIEAPLGAWFGANNALSASAWVYATSSTNGPIFGVTSTVPPGGWNMPFLSIIGATVYGWLWNVGTGNTPLSATVSLNAWHHLVITYAPGGAGEIFYVDGVSMGAKAGTYSPSGAADNWSTFMPSSRISGMNTTLAGRIDEVRAYNRTLSAAEVSILFYARQTCNSSTCGGCAGGETICGGACTNLQLDVSNCGACGTVCNTAGAETCVAGACGCVSTTDCSSFCVDTTTDSNNCGGCGTVCGPPVTCGSCDSGMDGLWHLDEGSGTTSADSSMNGNTATLTNSPAWTVGHTGDGLSFNGTNNYLNAALGTWFGANNALSASAWVFATATTNGPIFGVVQTRPGSGWNMPFLSVNGATVYGHIWNVNGNTPVSATVSLNAWHLVTITYDPASGGNERFYVDGALQASKTGTFSSSGASMYVSTYVSANRPAGVNAYLKGLIDDVRAYKRALAAGEVSLLYNAVHACEASMCGGCPAGTTLCGAICTNLAADTNNCNACGNVCPGAQTCVSSVCM